MGNRLTPTKMALLITIVLGIALIVLYFLRSRFPRFRELMDKYVPVNPFNITNIVLSAEQEKYVSQLHPKYRETFRRFIKECEDNGWSILITSGYRDFQSQYKQWQADNRNAKPGKSHHNYGLAIDINATRENQWLRKASSQKEWTDSGIPDIAAKHGISWQYAFGTMKDPVHFFIKKDVNSLYASALNAAGGDETKIVGNQVYIA